MVRSLAQNIEMTKTDPDEQMIVDRIYSAVMEQRLSPKTKLSESVLCESFGVGRMRVRRALLLLSSQGIIDLHSNRGAYVACPGADEAREVFEARVIIETGIVRELARSVNKKSIAALRKHVVAEDRARQRDDRSELIRMSGEFHVELAKSHGNSVLTRTILQLVTRTSLIVALFGNNKYSICPDDEHDNIINAIAEGNPEKAALEIGQHLQHIQDGLQLDQEKQQTIDVAQILKGM